MTDFDGSRVLIIPWSQVRVLAGPPSPIGIIGLWRREQGIRVPWCEPLEGRATRSLQGPQEACHLPRISWCTPSDVVGLLSFTRIPKARESGYENILGVDAQSSHRCPCCRYLSGCCKLPGLPLTVPLLTVGGRKLVLNLPDAVGLIVFVCLAAAILYIIGHGVWRAISFLWSRF